ncbi:hypothetical protein HK405_011270 [Cladochytrium tenue]|nr:hypothetical protein HK405_011270 [Cladochytrium tenue]
MVGAIKQVPALVSAFSGTLAEIRARAIQSYRDWIRAAPHVVELYQLDVTTADLRTRVRREFERSRAVADVGTANVLLARSRREFEETLNFWKQKSHVMRYFDADAAPGQGGDHYAAPARLPGRPQAGAGASAFLADFYEGR